MILKRILKRRPKSGSAGSTTRPAPPTADPTEELRGLLARAGRQDGARLRELLAAGAAGLPLAQRLEGLEQCGDPVLQAYVARNGREVELRLAAVDLVQGERLLEEVALHDRVSRVRQRAVARLESHDALERVWKATRGQDARVAREARRQLDALESAEARASAVRDAHLRLCEEAEQLTDSLPREAVEAAVQRLRNRWQAQPVPPSTELEQRFRDALDAALSKLQADRERRQPVQARIRALDELAAEVVRAHADAVAHVQHALTQLEADPLPEPVPDDLRQPLRESRELLEHWVEDMRAWFAHQGSIEAMLDALDDPVQRDDPAHRRHLEEQIAALPWRTPLPEPDSLREARQRLADGAPQAGTSEPAKPSRDDSQAREARLQPVRQALQAMLPEAAQALDAGDLRRARRLLNRAQHKAEQLPRRERQQFDEQLRPLLARAQELQDWRRFAVLPKQEALCERMEALAGEPLSPPEQVDAIQALRAEWKALGGSDSRESRKLWERFQAAADQAFEPCRAWFQEQREIRKQHLQERNRIVEQLEQFLQTEGWADTPVADLERIHSTAKAEWRAASPVDPQAARGVKRRFRKAMDRLGDVLGAHRQAVREEKKLLLDEARTLAEAENLAAAAGRARELQARWRELPALPMGEERRRHRELRAACDRVFQQLRERHAEHDQRRQQELEQAEVLCQRLEDAAASHASAGPLKQLLAELRREWSGLPGNSRKSLEGRFRKAEAAVLRQLDELERAAWLDALKPLRQAAGLVRAAEAAVQRQSPADANGLEAEWQTLEEAAVPESLQARWHQALGWLEQGAAPDAALLQGAAERRRQLCVELEILAGLESPEDDQDLRLRLQVDRLSASLGHQQPSAVHMDDLEQLVQDWYQLAPWPLDPDDHWEARFSRALRAAAGSRAAS